MKIQKISENQIKFVLTQDDLNLRNMQLHELSYGSAKAQELFSEIMQRAGVECGFYTSKDTPLIIEAIPVHENGIVVMITKITNYADLENTGMAAVLKNFGQQLFPDFMPPCGASPFDIFEHLANLPHHMPHMPHMHQQQLSPDHDHLIFEFESLDQAAAACARINTAYIKSNNCLYKYDSRYYLTIDNSKQKIPQAQINLLKEYGTGFSNREMSKLRLLEHGEVIIKKNAVNILTAYLS